MESHKLLREVEKLIAARENSPDWLKEICALLQRARSHYDWVGLYFLDGNDLVLGPFVGAPTPHTRIPLNKGVCGVAIRERKTLIVPDVNADPNYIPCALETKSEIVVPVEAEGRVLCGIDVDSHTHNAFGADDHQLLEQIAQQLAPVLLPVPKSA